MNSREKSVYFVSWEFTSNTDKLSFLNPVNLLFFYDFKRSVLLELFLPQTSKLNFHFASQKRLKWKFTSCHNDWALLLRDSWEEFITNGMKIEFLRWKIVGIIFSRCGSSFLRCLQLRWIKWNFQLKSSAFLLFLKTLWKIIGANIPFKQYNDLLSVLRSTQEIINLNNLKNLLPTINSWTLETALSLDDFVFSFYSWLFLGILSESNFCALIKILHLLRSKFKHARN